MHSKRARIPAKPYAKYYPHQDDDRKWKRIPLLVIVAGPFRMCGRKFLRSLRYLRLRGSTTSLPDRDSGKWHSETLGQTESLQPHEHQVLATTHRLQVQNYKGDFTVDESAICAYCLVAIVQHDMRLDRSTYEVLQILSMSLTDTTHLRDLFDKTIFKNDKDRSGSGEPNLFNYNYNVTYWVKAS